MDWQTALMLTIVITLATTSSVLIYTDIKSKEFDEDEDEWFSSFFTKIGIFSRKYNTIEL